VVLAVCLLAHFLLLLELHTQSLLVLVGLLTPQVQTVCSVLLPLQVVVVVLD
jgi:hypothetical protein